MFLCSSWIHRVGVAMLLVASLGIASVAPPHADGADDIACNPVTAAHDESAHSIGAAPTPLPAESDHCFLCHSFRSFYPAFDTFEQHHYTPSTERMHPAPINPASVVAWTLVPGRAPPA